MALAARRVCVLDAPKAPIDDPELADALQAKGKRIVQTTVVVTMVRPIETPMMTKPGITQFHICARKIVHARPNTSPISITVGR